MILYVLQVLNVGDHETGNYFSADGANFLLQYLGDTVLFTFLGENIA